MSKSLHSEAPKHILSGFQQDDHLDHTERCVECDCIPVNPHRIHMQTWCTDCVAELWGQREVEKDE